MNFSKAKFIAFNSTVFIAGIFGLSTLFSGGVRAGVDVVIQNSEEIDYYNTDFMDERTGGVVTVNSSRGAVLANNRMWDGIIADCFDVLKSVSIETPKAKSSKDEFVDVQVLYGNIVETVTMWQGSGKLKAYSRSDQDIEVRTSEAYNLIYYIMDKGIGLDKLTLVWGVNSIQVDLNGMSGVSNIFDKACTKLESSKKP